MTLQGEVRGVGLGLRWEFIDELVRDLPEGIDFLEVSPENYVGRGGRFPAALERLRARYPIVTHGLTMSFGGTDPLDAAYLRALASFVRDVGSPFHSDHLCFGAFGGAMLHELLPLAFTEATAMRVADRVREARDALGVPLAVENVSFYMHPGAREMSEAEFVTRVCELADCGLMLDVNNVYVNATNFGFDALEAVLAMPLDRVVEVHVAGHDWVDERDYVPGAKGRLILDTHGADVIDPVLQLLGEALRRTGPVPVLLERDQSIPRLDELLAELGRVRSVVVRALGAEDDAALREVGE